MIKPKRTAEQQIANEAKRRALHPLTSKQAISNEQAEPEFKRTTSTSEQTGSRVRRRNSRRRNEIGQRSKGTHLHYGGSTPDDMVQSRAAILMKRNRRG
jgi:hypothetical protein